MIPVSNLINSLFPSIGNDTYTQRFSSNFPVDRVIGARQTLIGYWADPQLWQTIAWARFAYERNPIIKGILGLIADYIGAPRVQWLGRKSKRLEALWLRFCRFNCIGDKGYLSHSEIAQDREKEMRIRWLRDGEVFIRFYHVSKGFPLQLRFVEPEQVRTPPTVATKTFDHSWGICTRIGDNEDIRGYWCFYPEEPNWEFVRASRMVYGRRNADRSIKRGLPEMTNVEVDLSALWSLLRNVNITSKNQSSIAWIEKYPSSVGDQILSAKSTAQQSETKNFFGPQQPGIYPGGSLDIGIDRSSYSGSSVLLTNGSKEFVPGPTSDASNYLEAAKSILHMLSLQWCLPDWMTKGAEAYASALVSGSPFARRIEGMQSEYRNILGQVAVTFQKLMVRFGYLDKSYLTVDPEVTSPNVIIADESKQVDLMTKELDKGLISEVEYIEKRGRNVKKTLEMRKKWKDLIKKYGLEENPNQQGQPGQQGQQGQPTASEEPNPPGTKIIDDEGV